MVGALYDRTSIKQWRFPKWTQSFASKYILPILATDTKKSSSRTRKVRARPPPSGESSIRRAPPPPPVNEEDIDTMFSMFPNYSRQDIQHALTTAKSDLNRAAEILLTTEPSAGSSRSS